MTLALADCNYFYLLRASIVKQLNQRGVRVVNGFPNLDQPNDGIIARLPAAAGPATATEKRRRGDARDERQREAVRRRRVGVGRLMKGFTPELQGKTRGRALLGFQLP